MEDGRGYEANLISTIVDNATSTMMMAQGYEANLISTIVDLATTGAMLSGL